MEIIGQQKLWSFSEDFIAAKPSTCSSVRTSAAAEVKSFVDLATKIAELQFMNSDYVLLFRGQTTDHKNNKGNSSLKPSLFRGIAGHNPKSLKLMERFTVLN